MSKLSELTAPFANALPEVLGGLAGVLLSIALAYAAYSLLHNIADMLQTSEHWFWVRLRRTCRFLINILLMIIALLHLIEYWVARAQ
jgi:hypothetical protein